MQNYQVTDKDFAEAMARREKSKKIIPAGAYQLDVQDYFDYRKDTSKHIHLPFSRMNNYFDLRKGELSLIAGFNGHGKSLLTNQFVLKLLKEGHHVAIASLEMPVRVTLGRMCSQYTKENYPDLERIKQYFDAVEHLYMFDHVGSVTPEIIFTAVELAHSRYDVNYFVIDSFMRCGIDQDGWDWQTKQKQFIEDLCSLCKSTGMHIFLVLHMRKPETGKNANEENLPNKYDIKGSGSIVDQADNIFIFWRNRKKEQMLKENDFAAHEKPDALFALVKQREGTGEECMVSLKYNNEGKYYTEWNNAEEIPL